MENSNHTAFSIVPVSLYPVYSFSFYCLLVEHRDPCILALWSHVSLDFVHFLSLGHLLHSSRFQIHRSVLKSLRSAASVMCASIAFTLVVIALSFVVAFCGMLSVPVPFTTRFARRMVRRDGKKGELRRRRSEERERFWVSGIADLCSFSSLISHFLSCVH
mgnify:CR=1 FL=1